MKSSSFDIEEYINSLPDDINEINIINKVILLYNI